MVVTDQHYPGWRAWVDGMERPIVRVAGFARGVEVTAGEHRLTMRYHSRSLAVGAVISGLTLLVALAFLVLGPGRSGRPEAPPARSP